MNELPELLGEQIVYSLNRNPCIQNPTTCTEEQLNATPAYLFSVDAPTWETIISKFIDQDWFKEQTESSIDQIIEFLVTPGETFSLDISLVELKARIRGEEGLPGSCVIDQFVGTLCIWRHAKSP